MISKQTQLWFLYHFYLGYQRVVRRFQRLYLWFANRPKLVPIINQKFEMADDISYIALLTRYLKDYCAYSDKDTPDFMQEPELYLHRRLGNCNDTSSTLLRFIKTYRPWLSSHLMIVYAPDSRGHCICIVETKEGYLHCSNWGVFKYYQSLNDVASSIYDNWYYYAIVDSNLNLVDVVCK